MPLYLYWQAKRYGFSSKYIKLSADTNFHMPSYVITRIEQRLKKEKKRLSSAKILVMGVTYKKDVKDLRKSPALRLISLLQDCAKAVDYYDPLIPYLEIFDIHQKISVELTPAQLKKYDCVVIATDHSCVDYDMVVHHARMIFDTRNIYAGVNNKKIERL